MEASLLTSGVRLRALSRAFVNGHFIRRDYSHFGTPAFCDTVLALRLQHKALYRSCSAQGDNFNEHRYEYPKSVLFFDIMAELTAELREQLALTRHINKYGQLADAFAWDEIANCFTTDTVFEFKVHSDLVGQGSCTDK